MGRKQNYVPLQVLLNNELVGHLTKEPGGVILFRYSQSWLGLNHAIPVSLSLPLTETVYRGAAVSAVFENLLPDSDTLRRKVAARVGASGIDCYSLLSQIGKDCVGALQFVAGDEELSSQKFRPVDGEPISESEIEHLLNSLAQSPLGLLEDDDFRISIAGSQEKTALLFHENRWKKPHGTTPTTHIFKTRIGMLQDGIDLSNSIENEYYCLKLMEEFGMPVNVVDIQQFGNTKALVVERFDRTWTQEGTVLRRPQEDCCQALSFPPYRKYQSDGGPGIVEILSLLNGSDTPLADQCKILKAQILWWLFGATDGHAKNISVFLGPQGSFQLTPFYDVLTAQPSFDSKQILRKHMKLAMSVGESRRYEMDRIEGRHFVQTWEKAGLPSKSCQELFEELIENAPKAFDALENKIPSQFPFDDLHRSVKTGATARLEKLARA